MRILLIEDEPAVARMVERGLAAHGHQVLATIRRARSDLPAIMLTARDDLASKVSALDGGADDYLTKPFAFAELLARIRALTRRADQPQASTRRADQPQASTLEFGDLRIDLLSHRAWRGGHPVDLSRREFALLAYFARNRGQVLSRQQILSAVWEYDFEGESNVVDVYVRYLRQKLDRPGEPSLVTTLRGSGYRFDPPTAYVPDLRILVDSMHRHDENRMRGPSSLYHVCFILPPYRDGGGDEHRRTADPTGSR